MVKLRSPLKDEHYIAIGEITANFALLELNISNLIWLLIGKEQRLGQIITSELSFKNLLNLLSSLGKYRLTDTKKQEKLLELIKKASEAEEKRNVVTHSVWGTGNTTKALTRIKMTAKRKHGWKLHSEQLTAKDLENIADYIGTVAKDVIDFIFDYEKIEVK